MTALGEAQRSALCSQLAALRRHGWPAGKALALVTAGLPAGTARDELAALQAGLERGEPPGLQDDPLLSLLARGDAATPACLEEAVRAFELSLASRRAAADGLVAVSVLGFVSLAALAVGAFVLEPSFSNVLSQSQVPAPTALVLWLLSLARPLLLLSPLFGVILFLQRARLARFLPGVRAFDLAAQLRLRAAALEAGLLSAPSFSLDQLPSLDRDERALAEEVLGRRGAAATLAMLASEKEFEGREQGRRLRAVSAPALVALGATVGAALVALYLPIFSIAGAIK